MLIFFTLIVIVYSSGDDCGKRTKIYNNHEHKENSNKENNNRGYYFVPETYVGDDPVLDFEVYKNYRIILYSKNLPRKEYNVISNYINIV